LSLKKTLDSTPKSSKPFSGALQLLTFRGSSESHAAKIQRKSWALFLAREEDWIVASVDPPVNKEGPQNDESVQEVDTEKKLVDMVRNMDVADTSAHKDLENVDDEQSADEEGYYNGSDSTSLSFMQWLSLNSPRTLMQSAGDDCWIHVHRRSTVHDQTNNEDLLGLHKSWIDFIDSNQSVSAGDIMKLARDHSVTGGCWMIYIHNGKLAEDLWRIGSERR